MDNSKVPLDIKLTRDQGIKPYNEFDAGNSFSFKHLADIGNNAGSDKAMRYNH